MKTVSGISPALGKLFDRLKERGVFVGGNPEHGFKFPKPKAIGSDHVRRATPGPHLIRDEKYWLPILALYHGNRLEEFAQLRIEGLKGS